MPNNHPTIDIISAPDESCPHPAYNCIEYCFAANAYIDDSGSFAFFIAEFQDGTVAAGTGVTFGGYEFETGTTTTQDTFVVGPTAQDTAQSIVTMLQANYAFSQQYDVSLQIVNGNPAVVFFANETGEVENFASDLAGLPVATSFEQNGTPKTYLGGEGGYKLVVEVWTCPGGVKGERIARKAYSPDPDTGEVCVDISTVVQPYAETVFLDPFTDNVPTDIYNTGAKLEVCLYYGDVYPDDETTCESEPRYFETTTPIEIVNAAFDRDDDEKFFPFCAEFGIGFRAMTNRPDFMPTCLDSVSWLYYCIPPEVIASGLLVFGFHLYTYADGSTSTFGTLPVTQQTGYGVIAFPAGGAQTFLQPGRTLVSYSVTLAVFLPPPFGLFALSQPIFYKVDPVLCCCYEEFYFLTRPGGVDTILFNCDREVDLQITSSEFCGYEPCEGSILEGGKREAEISAYEIYRTTSIPVPGYAINWYREFFTSPDRRVRKNGKVYRIVMLSKQIPMYRKDGNIYYTFEYILSFELNTQQN